MKKIPEMLRRTLCFVNVQQFLKFSFVGFVNTAIFYGIYYFLLQLGFFYVTALTIGTMAGLVNSYVWNKFFTFKSKERSASESFKFLAVYGVQYLSNLLIIYLCVEFVGISPELAGLAAICVGVFISYFGHKLWTFRKIG